MKQSCKILVVGIIAFSLIAGPAFFAFPKTTHADASSCLMGILTGKLTGTTQVTTASAIGTGRVAAASATGAVGGMMSVPVYDSSVVSMIKASNAAVADMVKANATINSNTAAQTNGLSIQRCIVEPLVTIMARTLLSKFTAQTVQWINSGFKGSPMYVTNPSGFMTDVADQTIGRFIDGLGPIGHMLCGPFDLQLRLALNLQFGLGGGGDYQEEIGCRLSDIEQNVQRAFTNGSFGVDGWASWIKMTSTPQNNPYGAYLKTVGAVGLQIGNTQYTLGKQLDWGKGFLSSVDPVTGEITTPGSLIEDQLSTTLGAQVQNVGLAKDIDAIIGALVGQMINQVMGGVGGLLGASSGGNNSAVHVGLTATPDSMVITNTASKNLPDGVLEASGFNTSVQFCQAFNKNLYANDTAKNSNGLPTNLIWVKIGGVGTYAKTAKTSGTQTVQWTLEDYNQISTYCQNVNITDPVISGVTDFNDATTVPPPVEITPATTVPVDREISLWTAELNQSYTYYSDYGQGFGPQRAIGGSSYSHTYGGTLPHWWTASLKQSEQVKVVKIQLYPDNNHTNYSTGVRVILANLPSEKMGAPITPADIDSSNEVMEFEFGDATARFPGLNYSGNASNFTITLDNPVTANAVLIIRRNVGSSLTIVDVKLYRPADAVIGGSGSGTATQQPSISFNPAVQSSAPNNQGDNYNASHPAFSTTFAVSASQLQNNLSTRVKFFRTTSSGDQPTAFSAAFTADSLKINNVPINTSENTFSLNQNVTVSHGDTYTIMGRISDTAMLTNTAYGNTVYLYYKIVTEIFKPATATTQETVVATQTTTFKIQ